MSDRSLDRTAWTARCEVYIIHLSHHLSPSFRQLWIFWQYHRRCSFYDFRLLWPWCRFKIIEETFDSDYCVLGEYGGRHVGDGIFVEGNAKIHGTGYLQIWKRISMGECLRDAEIPSRKEPLCVITSPEKFHNKPFTCILANESLLLLQRPASADSARPLWTLQSNSISRCTYFRWPWLSQTNVSFTSSNKMSRVVVPSPDRLTYIVLKVLKIKGVR